MTNQDFASAKDVGTGAMLRLSLLAVGLIAAGLALWASDDQHHAPSAILVFERS
jgi:hypothetical protein